MSSAEHALYTPLLRLYERNGYLCEREFCVLLPDEVKSRFIDLLAVRWKGNDVEVVAVEAKHADTPAAVLGGLAQVVDYQVVVPLVMLSARCPGSLLRHAREALQTLGAGYIVSRKGAGAAEAFAASTAPWFNRRAYAETVRNGALFLLLAEDLDEAIGGHTTVQSVVRHAEAPKGARARRESDPTWICSAFDKEDDVQIMLQARTRAEGGGRRPPVTACVWVERKQPLRKIWGRADPAQLERVLRSSGVTLSAAARLRRWHRLGEAHAKRKVPTKNVASVVRWANKQLAQPHVSVVIDVRVPLWDAGDEPDKRQARRALKGALAKLLPVRRALQELL